MTETTKEMLRTDDDFVVMSLPWQEVIRVAHRRALEAKQEGEEPIVRADADTATPA
ncbi:hypothetical protein GJR96_10035 [Haloferax sp. MBLA0076]|uniref:Uncharacterized protein n=1 Tax=Haloferax litoreum TaxID=2666140 RepID=A0A6A8GGJ9_9EURY|nr:MULTISPECIES: hypothetical protein [Haloferax]MRX22293.1 hypothetical protein [Haloferax litoreum]